MEHSFCIAMAKRLNRQLDSTIVGRFAISKTQKIIADAGRKFLAEGGINMFSNNINFQTPEAIVGILPLAWSKKKNDFTSRGLSLHSLPASVNHTDQSIPVQSRNS